jgi:hypothetical protein
MTQDAHLKIVHKTSNGKNKKIYPINGAYIHGQVNGPQLTA